VLLPGHGLRWGDEYMQNLHLQINPVFIPMTSRVIINPKSNIALNLYRNKNRLKNLAKNKKFSLP
jgi:hypothetical protein